MGAFTLIELLTSVVVFTILASLLLTSVLKAKERANGIRCTNNLRQITASWQMYAHDNADRVTAPGNTRDEDYAWVAGRMNYSSDNEDNTNRVLLIDSPYSKLGPYAKIPELYKCPSDRSFVNINGRRHPRVRSISMNEALGGPGEWLPPAPGLIRQQTNYFTYYTLASMVAPSPSELFVLIEEHPDSINAGGFANKMVEDEKDAWLIDFPANYHNGAAGISFADGHIETHRWQDSRTLVRPNYIGSLHLNVKSPNNQDVVWLAKHTSAKRVYAEGP